MSRLRITSSPIYVSLSETRVHEIRDLVESWDPETRRYVSRQLNTFVYPQTLTSILVRSFRRALFNREKDLVFLKDPEKLTNLENRYTASGSRDLSETWKKIILRELDYEDFVYLRFLLSQENCDTYLPENIRKTFELFYKRFILKEFSNDPELPKAPIMLVIGRSGSGKSATVSQALDEIFYSHPVYPDIDLSAKKASILANQPIWKSIEEVDPELAIQIQKKRKRYWLKIFSKVPIIRYIFRKKISTAIAAVAEDGVMTDFGVVTPNDYQTAWSGEPGNYFRKAMGRETRLTIRHLEEVHSAFGKPDNLSTAKGQQGSLTDASNIVLDEIIHGKRDCILIATTDRPEQIEPSIYRRFVERGLILDLSEVWKEPVNLRELVRREIQIFFGSKDEHISEEKLDECTSRLYTVFQQRGLKLTAAYTRRLIAEILKLKRKLKPEYLEDPLLVREALRAVAKNSYGELYEKTVGRLERTALWDDYIGSIKNDFSELANNSLFYNISEEKGVVLAGPPGSGKTFMVRSWLGDNTDVQDLSVSVSDLNEDSKPIEAFIRNLEKVYDIAKMLSPSMVFFDEGDAIAPRRSSQGTNPYDKITNRFLSLIDGDSQLVKVFTVLTTNRLDLIDPALVRSKRLKVLNVTGHLRDSDGAQIIEKELKDTPLEDGLTYENIASVAKPVCDTPADFALYAEKLRTMRETEKEVSEEFLKSAEDDSGAFLRFVQFNYKILLGLIERLGSDELLKISQQSFETLASRRDEIVKRLSELKLQKNFELSKWHVEKTYSQLSESPTKRGKQQLDSFLESELSEEPQIGFVVGVGANDTSGVLLPIASSLVFNEGGPLVQVTGAVSSDAQGGSAELDMAVQMTHQSAKESYTLILNYLHWLSDIPASEELEFQRKFGEYYRNVTLHHQLLSTSYSVGGPSAGFALAINTLSTLFSIKVRHDFGITGAPWIKGTTLSEIGSPVLIGGHHKKTEKVLQHLQRMYMPEQNYLDMPSEVLDAYRILGKDVVPITSFSSLAPEVYSFDASYDDLVSELFELRSKSYLNEEAKVDSIALQKKIREIFEQKLIDLLNTRV